MDEQIYNDFVEKVMPKIAEGFTITKDYFFELATRYIKYLIIMDSLAIFLNLLIIIFPLFFAYKYRDKIIDDTDEVAFIFLLLLIVPFAFICDKTTDLVKDLTIPEVRIYEELNNMKK